MSDAAYSSMPSVRGRSAQSARWYFFVSFTPKRASRSEASPSPSSAEQGGVDLSVDEATDADAEVATEQAKVESPTRA